MTTMLFVSSEQWQPKGRQNIITVFTTSLPGWVSAGKCQCTEAIMTVWPQPLWAYPTMKVKVTAWSMGRKMCANKVSFITKLHAWNCALQRSQRC